MTELSWITEARKHVGQREIGSTNTSPLIEEWQSYLLGIKMHSKHWLYRTAWCGTFVAYCLKKQGITIPKHWYRALDYLNCGTKLNKPAYGCVAVKNRKPEGGHVCFVIGRDKKTGNLICLGGNQNNKVCFAAYKESDFIAFMWYGREKQPLASRYNLPDLTVQAVNKLSES